jgi:beta-galactosidase
VGNAPKSAALIFSYESDWVTKVQPQGQGFSALRLAFEFYTALRTLGMNVDIIAPDAPLDGYAIIAVPCLPILPAGFVDRLKAFDGPVVIGPRTGSKTRDFAIPGQLPPGDLQNILPLKIVRVESLRPGSVNEGEGFIVRHWLEDVETALPATHRIDYGRGVVFAADKRRYVACWPDQALLTAVLTSLLPGTQRIPETLRLRKTDDLCFAFNYGTTSLTLAPHDFVLGGSDLPPAGVAVWRI